MSEQPEKKFSSKRRSFDTSQNAGMIVFKLKRNSSFRIELHTNKAIECKYRKIQCLLTSLDFSCKVGTKGARNKSSSKFSH